ncbi:hypothetical protein AAHE18_14G151600 [Arachis hypogaea]
MIRAIFVAFLLLSYILTFFLTPTVANCSGTSGFVGTRNPFCTKTRVCACPRHSPETHPGHG